MIKMQPKLFYVRKTPSEDGEYTIYSEGPSDAFCSLLEASSVVEFDEYQIKTSLSVLTGQPADSFKFFRDTEDYEIYQLNE